MKPNRSILSVPGHNAKMHAKATQAEVDVVMLDLEDSVPVGSKSEARRQVISSLKRLNWGRKLLSVRMNSTDTPFAFEDAYALVEEAGDVLDSIVLPKVNHEADVHFLDRLLWGMSQKRYADKDSKAHQIQIEACIETVQGIERISQIAASSDRLKSLVYGIADYSASLGARLASISGHGETDEEIVTGHRWHFPLSRIAQTAKAHGLMAIDAPYGNFNDEDGLERATAIALALGFDGKWAIHPAQLGTINRVMSPSAGDIELARKVLDANRLAGERGQGAIAVEGRMVDQATVRLARQLWEQAKQLGLLQDQ